VGTANQKVSFANRHRWAQLTKKLASLTAIPIVKILALLPLVRYFAHFFSFANTSPLINYKIVILGNGAKQYRNL